MNDVAFSADGSMLATTGDDGTLKIWDPKTGDNLRTFSGTGAVWGPSFGASSLVAAAWIDEGKVRVFDASTGPSDRALDFIGMPPTLSPDGRWLAVSNWDSDPEVLDVATGKVAFTLHDQATSSTWRGPRTVDRIATGDTDGTAKIWDGKTGELLLTLFGHHAPVGSVDWSPDSSRLVTGSDDGTAKVWELTDTGAREQLSLAALDTRAGVTAVFSPDGKQVMTSDSSDHHNQDLGCGDRWRCRVDEPARTSGFGAGLLLVW